MAVSKNNIITHGLSGTVGDMLVFSQRGGKTIVSNVADRSHVVLSDKQIQQTRLFQKATIYAKAAIKDPNTKAAYTLHAKEDENAYNVAVADLLNAPEIESIDLTRYTGKTGDTITITATDDFNVVEVTAAIYDSKGNVIEQGNAVQDETAIAWVYTATKDAGDIHSSKIIIKASDLPGNLTEKDTTIPA